MHVGLARSTLYLSGLLPLSLLLSTSSPAGGRFPRCHTLCPACTLAGTVATLNVTYTWHQNVIQKIEIFIFRNQRPAWTIFYRNSTLRSKIPSNVSFGSNFEIIWLDFVFMGTRGSLTSLDLTLCPAEGSMSPALKEQVNAQGCGI